MILAAYDDTGYNLLLLLHIVAVLVAFAPAAINPLLERYFVRNGGEAALQSWAGFARDYTKKIALSSLVVVLITGILLIVMSDDAWEFDQTWISLAFLVWIAIGGVVSALILKGEKLVAAGDMKGRELLAKGGPIATVLLLVMLYLMIFKPGA
ncbi:MAG TPA: hypothetical protein VFU14_04005 [Acidimicrobiales bacterium]|nr:hypothetical protein [Acidimicrobiales bacterium]